jgi:peptide/nickel transport system permease protein
VNDTALPHYANPAPFNPQEAEKLTPELQRYYMASQWRMMWWKLKRHRLAVASGVILLVMYASILITEFLAPYSLHTRNTDFIFAPPQSVHLFHEGSFVGPFVYGFNYKLDLDTLRREYTDDTSRIY